MTSQLLIVDADATSRFVLAGLLRPQFMLVEASTIAQARSLVCSNPADFQAVVIEAWLPDGDSRPFCTELSSRLGLPVIVITSMDAAGEAVRSLDAGASDHVLKPVRSAELRARLRAHLRSAETSIGRRISLGRLAFYPGQRLIQDASRRQQVHLTRLETSILRVLHGAAGELVSKAALDIAVWGAGGTPAHEHALEAHVYRLRRKLNAIEPHWQLLVTVGNGYRLAIDN